MIGDGEQAHDVAARGVADGFEIDLGNFADGADEIVIGAIGIIAPSLITEWNISKPALAPVLSAA